MGHMATKVLSRAGDILVFLPLAHAIGDYSLLHLPRRRDQALRCVPMAFLVLFSSGSRGALLHGEIDHPPAFEGSPEREGRKGLPGAILLPLHRNLPACVQVHLDEG